MIDATATARAAPPLAEMAPGDGFLGLAADDAVPYADAGAVVIPFGLEASVTYGGGTALGPQAILDASHQVELFDEDLWREPFSDWGVATLTAPAIDEGSVPAALDRLAAIAERVVAAGKFPLVLGGEHGLTAGAIRPFIARHDELLVVQFDAHADLRDGYAGEHFSHAAAMRRVLDAPNVKLAGFGIRNISAEEIPFLEENGDRIAIYWAKDKAEWRLAEIAERFRGKDIYLTVDVDGFDSSLMPATGTPEPGGLFWDDVIPIIKCAASLGRIVGADICELAPIAGNHAPNFLAAKLAYKILGYALSR